MKRKPIQSMMAAVMLVTTLWSGTPAFANSVGAEVKINSGQPQITKDGFDIAEDYAVWIVEGEKTITLYDLDDSTETKIGDSRSAKTNPKVDGKYVVWIDSRHGGSDVYLYDISKKKEKRITSDSTVGTDIEIYGNNIVWTDTRNKGTDVYLYNISTDTEEQVSTSGAASKPTVSQSYVAWQDKRNKKDADIYYYDIKAQEEKEAVVSTGEQTNPVIDGDQIVYEQFGGDQLYMYTIRTKRNKKLTSDSSIKSVPHLYEDTYVYLSKSTLMLGDVDEDDVEKISSRVYSRLQPRIYEDYILFAKTDEEGRVRLHMYDLDEDEEVTLGGESGDPSDPAGSDRYVVYVSSAKRASNVILYDVETGASQVISKTDSDPIRPLVSNRYAVWYDKSDKALMSYDIRKGKLSKVTDKSVKPLRDYYELDGNNLIWINEDRRNQLVLTNLSTGKNVDVARLSKDPLSIDIYGEYITWVLEDSRNKATIYLYDIDRDRDSKIRSGVQVEKASIGDNFVVWSEYAEGTDPSWDLYYYDLDRGRTNLLLRWNSRDQLDPQASRNMVLFTDNRLSPKPRDFYFELFDVEEDSFSKYYWKDEAKMESPRIGGNRVVWIDERDGDPFVYTMAFAKAREDEDDDDDDDDTDNGGIDYGDYTDYPFAKALEDDLFLDLLDNHDFDDIAFVAFARTNKEIVLYLNDALDNSDRLLDLLDDAGMDDLSIRVYK